MRQRLAPALVSLALFAAGMAALALLCAGCSGLGTGKPTASMYTFNIAADAKSTIVVGSAGTQTYMPQTPEAPEQIDTGKASAATTADATATGATQAAVSKGKMAMAIAGSDNNRRTAENDLSAVAQLLQGNEQTQAGQTPTSAQRDSTGTGSGTQTQTPTATRTDTTTVAPNLAATASGPAAVSNPAAATSGPTSMATAGSAAPLPAPAAADKNGINAIRNADGTVTVNCDDGTAVTGKATAAGQGPNGTQRWFVAPESGTLVRVTVPQIVSDIIAGK